MKNYLIIGIIGFLALLGVVAYCNKEKLFPKKPAPTPDNPNQTGNFSGTVSGVSNVLSASILLVVVLVGMTALLIVYGVSWSAKKVAQNPDKALDVGERVAGIVGKTRGRG